MPVRVAFYFWEYPNPKPRSRAPLRTTWRMPAYEAVKRLPAGAKPCSPPEWRDLDLPGEIHATHGQGFTEAEQRIRATYPLIKPGDPGHPDNPIEPS